MKLLELSYVPVIRPKYRPTTFHVPTITITSTSQLVSLPMHSVQVSINLDNFSNFSNTLIT